MLKVHVVCSLASFLIVVLILFINRPNLSRDLTIFMISSTSLFEIINVVISDPKLLLCILGSDADAANGIKTF